MNSHPGHGGKVVWIFCSTLMTVGLLLCVSGCTGCTLLERSNVLNVARRTVSAASDLPSGAILLPTSQWEIYVAKNAAQVYIPYRYTDASGRERHGTYMVRAKRVKLTWVLDYSRILPDDGNATTPEARP